MDNQRLEKILKVTRDKSTFRQANNKTERQEKIL